MAQYKGVVRGFNNAKGYGFLGRGDGPDVFVHYTAIQKEGYKTLKEGDGVEYNIIQGEKDHRPTRCYSRSTLPDPIGGGWRNSAALLSFSEHHTCTV